MPLDSLTQIIDFLADMPSSNLARTAEDYVVEKQDPGKEYEALKVEIANDEGRKYEVYLDSEGYPTIGIGHKITAGERSKYPRAKKKYKNNKAGKEQMKRDFTLDGKVLTWDDATIDRNYNRDFPAMLEGAKRAYNFRSRQVNGMQWNDLPLDARYSIANMTYTLGEEGIKNKFPGFLKATAQGQWELAAHEIKYKSGKRFLEGNWSPYSTYFGQLHGGRVGWDQGYHPRTGRKIWDIDGEKRTEYSYTAGFEDGYYNFPSIPWDSTDGKSIDQRSAYFKARETGEVIGPFKTEQEAVKAAKARSLMLDEYYTNAVNKPIDTARSLRQFNRVLNLGKPKQQSSSNMGKILQEELNNGR